MAQLTLYTNPMSRGRIARWAIEELATPYKTVLLDYGSSMKAPDYLAINPMGKVPAITHGDIAVTECAAICAYLGDAFPQAGLAPPVDGALRGPYYRWLFFGAGPVEAAVTNRSLGFDTEGQESQMGYGAFDHVMNALEGALRDREYLVGDSFTMADVYLGSQISWGLGFGTMEERPGFRAYVERITARPAAKRAAEIDDAAMPQTA
ncbi:MAG: glutathione S-transferase family protein [Paracoccaceae bacterium]